MYIYNYPCCVPRRLRCRVIQFVMGARHLIDLIYTKSYLLLILSKANRRLSSST